MVFIKLFFFSFFFVVAPQLALRFKGNETSYNSNSKFAATDLLTAGVRIKSFIDSFCFKIENKI